MTSTLLDIDTVARAAISSFLWNCKLGDTVVPDQMITFTYTRYPFSQADLSRAIKKHITSIHTNSRTIEKQPGGYDYVVVASKREQVKMRWKS